MYKFARILLISFLLLISTSCQESKAPSAAGAEKSNDKNLVDDILAQADRDEKLAKNRVVKNILIFGDSITAGYGLAPELAYPALLQSKIDGEGWDFHIIDGGLSGDTSAGGLRRINWMLKESVDVLVLELGGNDGLRGTPPEVTKQNLQAIIDAVKKENEEAVIILAGMQIPPNLGVEYTTRFKNVFPELAAENNAHLIPFILNNVGGIPSLNQPDGIHPTAEGHKIVADNVWEILAPVLTEMHTGKPAL